MLPRPQGITGLQRLIISLMQLQAEGKKVSSMARLALQCCGEDTLTEIELLNDIIETETIEKEER